MSVFLTNEFLADLRDCGDTRLVRQALRHTLSEDGSLKPDRDDHRYRGIDGAWIRYVSRGNSAYRVIYIRKDDHIFLYRVGRHDVEDRLAAPTSLVSALEVKQAPPSETRLVPTSGLGLLLKTTEATYLNRYLESLYHLRHKEIYLVAPYVEPSLLASQHPFGRFLDRAVEDGTDVVVVTCHQPAEMLPSFKNLEERQINVFFSQGLHTKLYFFDIDLHTRNSYQQHLTSTAIVGSPNLTFAGLGMGDSRVNEELCCTLVGEVIEELRTYITKLVTHADDYARYAFSLARRSKV